MTFTRRNACLALIAAAAHPAWAQTYPSKPVTIVVPQAPGGTNDALGRILAQKLTERLGQSFVVDNRAGAGGNIGTALAAKAPKDGYTLLLTIRAPRPSIRRCTRARASIPSRTSIRSPRWASCRTCWWSIRRSRPRRCRSSSPS